MGTMREAGLVAVMVAALGLMAAGAIAGPHDGRGHGHGGRSGIHGRSGGPGGHGGGIACDPASVTTVLADVGSACPCDGLDDGAGGVVPWRNHGQYVRCVAHALRDATRAAAMKRRCVTGVVPCAAWSTCGRTNAVTCVVTTPDQCVGGVCGNDASKSCTTDADCSTQTCAVTTADRCTQAGGSAGSGSCCTASPSGAFLDAPADF